jgi:DNA-directed RNA polymerase subunit N (RpoN/RPB10)
VEPNKTKVIEFGRFAIGNAAVKGQGKKPATFDFLGFTHYCSRRNQAEAET